LLQAPIEALERVPVRALVQDPFLQNLQLVWAENHRKSYHLNCKRQR
jgi:hypothetical protein